MASSSSSSSSYNSPCAACKFLRRKCLPGCIFSPYFPPEDPQKFANVHKIFGASNVTKLLNELLPHQREDAVNSLAYEAEARVRDPVYGCVGAISYLQRQVHRLQKELDAANADLLRFAACHNQGPGSSTSASATQAMVVAAGTAALAPPTLTAPLPPPPPPPPPSVVVRPSGVLEYHGGVGGVFYDNSFEIPSSLAGLEPWHDDVSDNMGGHEAGRDHIM